MSEQGNIKVYCGSCKHQWKEGLDLPMDLLEVANLLSDMRCSKCGSKNLLVGNPSVVK